MAGAGDAVEEVDHPFAGDGRPSGAGQADAVFKNNGDDHCPQGSGAQNGPGSGGQDDLAGSDVFSTPDQRRPDDGQQGKAPRYWRDSLGHFRLSLLVID
jgi:hypothetical protein